MITVDENGTLRSKKEKWRETQGKFGRDLTLRTSTGTME